VAVQSSVPCSLKGRHHPKAAYSEEHHVIPVAWQQFYVPAASPQDAVPGKDPDGRGELWDSRTVPLCPTSHRNVHVLIVAIVHLLAARAAKSPGQAGHKALLEHGLAESELTVAVLGVQRFIGAGGDVGELAKHGLYGEA
jgi:hypothetical protein